MNLIKIIALILVFSTLLVLIPVNNAYAVSAFDFVSNDIDTVLNSFKTQGVPTGGFINSWGSQPNNWQWKYDTNLKAYVVALKTPNNTYISVPILLDSLKTQLTTEEFLELDSMNYVFDAKGGTIYSPDGKTYTVEKDNVSRSLRSGGGGVTRGGGAGRENRYYTEKQTDPVSGEEYVLDEDGNQVFIVNQGDTWNTSVFDYTSNEFNDLSQKTTMSLEIGELTYDHRRQTYNYFIDQSTNYYITYNISNVSYFYTNATESVEERFYYELPDGRNSGDLTINEIEGLAVDFDVIPYINTYSDTLTKALYHFDGEIKDSSYYNNTWSFHSGASYTFYDMGGKFEDALYLDKLEHVLDLGVDAFNVNDFTFSMRYYCEQNKEPNKIVGNIVLKDNTNSSVNLFYFMNENTISIDSVNKVSMSPGQWYTITYEQYNGYSYLYLNGVLIGTLLRTIQNFTPEVVRIMTHYRQEWCYIDEVRIVDDSLYGGNGYVPSPVPYDTNLIMALPENAKEKTIAVQTNIDILNYRIGGVRPTFPDKGQVYFYLNEGKITSAQIYNGVYWEEVNCRIYIDGRWLHPQTVSLTTVGEYWDINEDVIADSGGSGVPGDPNGPDKGSGFSWLWNIIGKLGTSTVGVIGTLLESIIMLVTTLISSLFNAVSSVFTLLFSGISNMTNFIVNVPDFVGGVYSAFPQEISSLYLGLISVLALVGVLKYFL